MFIGYTSATCHNIADFMLYGIFHAIQIVKKKKKESIKIGTANVVGNVKKTVSSQ